MAETGTFHNFFDSWLVDQDHHLQLLIAASERRQDIRSAGLTESTQETEEEALRSLVDRVIQRYEHYYEVKTRWAHEDVWTMLSPSWTTIIEDAFLWIGGWRPTMAFHLFYSKSGLQLESRFPELISGIGTGDLGDLSPIQLVRIDELQRRTIREEREITERMARQQEKVADTSMVELSHVVSEMLRSGGGEVEDGDRVESTLAEKEEGLEDILQMADDLRLRTLKRVVDILNPTQAVHFLIAAAELHLRLHDWGKKREANHHQHNHRDAPRGGGPEPSLTPR